MAAKKGLPPFMMKKGMKEGSKAEEAMDRKQGVKMPKGKMPAFKKGGAVKKGC